MDRSHSVVGYRRNLPVGVDGEGAAADEVEEEKTAPSQHQFVLDRIQYNKEKKERIQVMRGKVAKQKLHNERKRERKIASRQHRPVVRDDDVDMPWQGDGKGKGPENAKAAKTHEHAKVILKNKKRSLSFRGKRMKQLQYEAANFWMTSEEDVEEELTGGKGRGGAKGSYTKKNLSLSSYSSTEWNTYRKAAADLKVKMTERAAGGSSPVASFTLAGTAQDVGDVCKAFRFLQELDRLTDDDIMAEVKDNFSFENMEALVAEAGREVQYRRQRRAKLSLDKMSDADFVVEAELTSFLVKLKRKLLELRWEHKVVKNEVNAVVSKIEEIVSSGGRKKGKSDTRAGRNGKRRQR